jgi:hypothetical protein
MEISEPAERSWQIRLSHGGDLTLCLYVRDRLGLMPDITPRLAALVPRVSQSASAPESIRSELEEQWTHWWRDRLRAHWDGHQPHFNEPADSFPEISASRALYEFVTAFADDGRAWVEASKQEFFEIFKSTRRHSNSIVELGNKYGIKAPFKLSVTFLPVDDTRGWSIDPEHVLASYRLYADWEGFSDWMAKVLASRAAR